MGWLSNLLGKGRSKVDLPPRQELEGWKLPLFCRDGFLPPDAGPVAVEEL